MQPLAFSPGFSVPHLSVNLPLATIEFWAIGILALIWILYTGILTFHWVAYGGFTHRGVPALSIHVIVSAVLFLLAFSGIANI